jgi:hypothetical protein
MSATRFQAKPKTDEWRVAWDALGKRLRADGWGDGMDRVQMNPFTHDRWEYLGTTRFPTHDLHTFQHEAHPTTHELVRILVATPPPRRRK